MQQKKNRFIRVAWLFFLTPVSFNSTVAIFVSYGLSEFVVTIRHYIGVKALPCPLSISRSHHVFFHLIVL